MPFDAPIPDLAFEADYWSLRFVDRQTRTWTVRKNVALPPASARERGVMATVHDRGGLGYAATSDLSAAGLRAASVSSQSPPSATYPAGASQALTVLASSP